MRYVFLGCALAAIACAVAGGLLPSAGYLLWIGIVLLILTVLAFLIRAIAGRKV